MGKKYLILDCNFLCHRAKYSTGGLSYGGTPTGVIYGFLKSITALQEQFNTPHVIFCWDSRTNKREQIFPAYKQKRRDRFKDLTEEEQAFENAFRVQMFRLRVYYLRWIGYKNIFVQGGYESDDIIASICLNLSHKDAALIISSDQDLYQLIRFNVSLWNPQKGKILTLQGFKKKYGIIPDQWSNVKVLAGCSTDEVPGVKGVGEKTAIKYIRRELKAESIAAKNIRSKKTDKIIDRNYPLVVLPFAGVNTFKLRKDKLSKSGWERVTTKLGMKSIRDKGPTTKKRKGKQNTKKRNLL